MKEDKLIPRWLKKTQNNSWEPEIFISGIVLYGLIQTPAYLEEFRHYFKREIFSFSNDIDNLIGILSTGVQWLIFGLVLHLFFRGIWIGLVGLSYVFPKGIDHSKLNFKGKFENKTQRIPHFSEQIIKLEKISSSIFSISYFIFMSIIGAYMFFVIAIFIPIYLLIYLSGIGLGEIANHPNIITALNTYIMIIVGIGVLYMIDFLALGMFRRVKWLSKIYYPIYRLVSTLTFSSLYRNVYYTLISNFKSWKVIVFIISFIAITMSLFNINVSNNSLSSATSRLEFFGSTQSNFASSNSYENMNPTSKFQQVTIQSDIIKDEVLRIFVSHNIAFEDSIRVNCDYKKLENNTSTDSLKLVCLGNFYNVAIDDSLYNAPDWLFHYDNTTNHRGIIGYVDISHLERGSHRLDLRLTNWHLKNYAIIPFYKQ